MNRSDDLQYLINQLREDHRMYQHMLGMVMKRMADLEALDADHHQRFVDWAPNAVLYNSLIICEAQVRGQLEDLSTHLEGQSAPVVRLVEKEDDRA